MDDLRLDQALHARRDLRWRDRSGRSMRLQDLWSCVVAGGQLGLLCALGRIGSAGSLDVFASVSLGSGKLAWGLLDARVDTAGTVTRVLLRGPEVIVNFSRRRPKTLHQGCSSGPDCRLTITGPLGNATKVILSVQWNQSLIWKT